MLCILIASTPTFVKARERLLMRKTRASRFVFHGKSVCQRMANNRDVEPQISFPNCCSSMSAFVTDQSRVPTNRKTLSLYLTKKPQRSPRRDRIFIPLITVQSFRGKKSVPLRRRAVLQRFPTSFARHSPTRGEPAARIRDHRGECTPKSEWGTSATGCRASVTSMYSVCPISFEAALSAVPAA